MIARSYKAAILLIGDVKEMDTTSSQREHPRNPTPRPRNKMGITNLIRAHWPGGGGGIDHSRCECFGAFLSDMVLMAPNLVTNALRYDTLVSDEYSN